MKKQQRQIRNTLCNLVGKAQQDSILVMFCSELEASDNQKELDYFCNSRCEFHRTPFELYCFPKSFKSQINANQKTEVK